MELNDHGREVADDVERTTDSIDQAQLRTLEEMLHQLPPVPAMDDSECHRLVQQVQQIGRQPRPKPEPSSDLAASPTAASLDLPALGQYKLLAKLGEGGMGAVYKALHTKLDKLVALKVLPADRLQDAAAVARFEREMRAVGKLAHENIVAALDAGEIDGTHYLVMELVAGVDLGTIARQQAPLPVAEACEIIRQAALGLQHAHANNLVHRDIKPSNLMLAEGSSGPLVKILDMGLALLDEQHAEHPDLTASGQIMGTLDYMAPEQAGDTHTVDIRADIYSLGATLYKLLTGRVPFQGPQYASTVKKLMALATQDPPRIDSFREDLPEELVDVVHRMLARQPQDRYATPAELAAAVAPFVEGANLTVLLEAATVVQVDAEQTALLQTVAKGAASVSVRSSVVETQSQVVPGRSRQSEFQPVAAPDNLPPRRFKRSVLLAITALPILVLGVILLSLRTPHGEIVVELANGIPAEAAKHLKIEVTGNGELKVADASAGWTIDVAEGKYQARLSGGSDEFQLEQHQVTVTRGQKALLKVSLKPLGETPTREQHAGTAPTPAPTSTVAKPWQPTPQQQAFFDHVPTLPADEQAAAVAKKLMEVNPGLDGKFNHKIEDGQVVAFTCHSEHLANIWPVRALSNLKELSCGNTNAASSIKPLSDLSPLQGLPLTVLSCSFSSVADLSPLRGMPLVHLTLQSVPVSDLSPLRGAPLSQLTISKSLVEDLTPLIGMQLEHFDCTSSKVKDLAPLKGMPLKHLHCGWTRVSDLSPITGMPLEFVTIGGTQITDLSPLAGMPVTYLDLRSLKTRDWSPLRGMPLTHLNCNGSTIADLSPVAGTKLTEVNIQRTYISDISPLAGMPVQKLCYDIRLFDEDDTALIQSFPLTHWSVSSFYSTFATPAAQTRKEVEARREAALTFARTTSMLPPSEQAKAVAAKLEELNSVGAIGLGVQPPKEAVTDVMLMLRGSTTMNITPLMAFTQLTKLEIIGGMYWLDISCVIHLPLEELKCSPEIAFKNAGVLKKVKTLKTVNGQPAAEYLENLLRDPPSGDAAMETSNGLWQPTAEQQAFFDQVATLPAEEQAAAVAKKLMELNPGFDGKTRHWVSRERVTEFGWTSNKITALWPVRALSHLESLRCRSSYEQGPSELQDLTPLQGLKITTLDISYTSVNDLGQLRGLPLSWLAIDRIPASDLSPLREMPLRTLTLNKVSSLSPLQGLQLTNLKCAPGSKFSDLSPLKGMPLTYLHISSSSVKDISPLSGMPLQHLECSNTSISDLSPLAKVPLEVLVCKDTKVADLTPLKGTPLKRINIQGTQVTDISPLKHTPIEVLWLDQRLFDEAEVALLKSLGLVEINAKGTRVLAADFFNELAARREAAQMFAQETAKLTVDDQVSAVRARLSELNLTGDFTVGFTRDGNSVVAVSVALNLAHYPQFRDITPLMALTNLKRLTLSGGRPSQDVSCVQFLPLEELNCDDEILFRNIGVLRQIESLKRVNGHPADEYLNYVSQEGLNHFARPKLPATPWDVTPEQQAFFDHVATLPAEEQADAVAKKLMDVNPGYDGKFEKAIHNGQVVEFRCHTDLITNPMTEVWPVRALRGLRVFYCRGNQIYQGNVTNLEQLRGMRLMSISIKDSPLRDLSPLIGMPLSHVAFYRTSIADLGPLQGMPLEHVQFDVRLFDEADEAVLSSLPLREINGSYGVGQPIDEFWKALADRRKAAQQFVDATSKLKPIDRFSAVVAKLDETHGAGVVRCAPKLEGQTLVEVEVHLASKDADLTPLMALTELKKLTLHDCVPWQDLSCLKFLPLEALTCNEDAAYKNNRSLRAIKTLRTINGMPAEQFWQKLGLETE